MAKKSLVIFGLCFAPELGYLLKLSPDFAREYEVSLYRIRTEGSAFADLDISEEKKQAANVFLYQPADWLNASYTEKYKVFVANLPRSAVHITYPYPTLPALWPFHNQDPRRLSVPQGETEEVDNLLLAYSDAQVMKMRREGKSAAEILKAYRAMDVASVLNLDQLLNHSLEKLTVLEQQTDIKVADFITSRFRDERVMISVNHGSNKLLIHMADQILAKLGFGPLPRYVHVALMDLVPPAIPIHPSVIAHFGLSWITDQTRCQTDRRRKLKWDEYILAVAKDV